MINFPRPTGGAGSQVLGVVTTLARYPVKSLGGELLPEVAVDPAGLSGDRRWAAYTADGGIGSGKTTRRFRRVDGLLALRAFLPHSGVPVIELPGGPAPVDTPAASAELSAVIGQPLELRREGRVRHHDESPVHVITTAGLRRLGRALGFPVHPARFRANIVLDVAGDDFVEDAWQGREIAIGPDVVLRLGAPMPRCVMVGLPQPELAPDNRILKEIALLHGMTFGLQAEVRRPGTIRLGDPAELR